MENINYITPVTHTEQKLETKKLPEKQIDLSEVDAIFLNAQSTLQESRDEKLESLQDKTIDPRQIELDIANILKEGGLNEKIVMNSKPETLKRLFLFLREVPVDKKIIDKGNDSAVRAMMARKVIEMVNRGNLGVFEKDASVNDYQTQVLLYLGINEEAVKKAALAVTKGTEEVAPENDIDRLYWTIGNTLVVADKIDALFPLITSASMMKTLLNATEGYQVLKENQVMKFTASEFYKNLSVIPLGTRVDLMEVIADSGKIIHESFDSEHLYSMTSGNTVFAISKSREITFGTTLLGRGISKIVSNCIRVNDFMLSDKVMIDMNGNLENEAKIMDKVKGASPYLSSPFESMVNAGGDRWIAFQEKLSGSTGKVGDGRTMYLKSPAEILIDLTKLTLALKAVHGNGVVHCDLKPENFMYDKNDNVRLADFGVSHVLPDGQERMKLESACGTETYVAPEVMFKQELSTKADSFSLGVVMLEAVYSKYIKGSSSRVLDKFEKKEYAGHLYNCKQSKIDQVIKFGIELVKSKETNSEDKEIMLGLADIASQLLTIDPNKRLACQDAVDKLKDMIESNKSTAKFKDEIVWETKVLRR